jgi:hypothetical protein
MKPDFISFYCGMLIGTGNAMMQIHQDEALAQSGVAILCLGLVSILAYIKVTIYRKEK